jgi:hypothetical protein
VHERQSSKIHRSSLNFLEDTMKKVTCLALAMAMALVAAPVFAASEGPNSFGAMNDMASGVTPLSDEQLAEVEGGVHFGNINILIGLAQNYATGGNLAVAQIVQAAAAVALLTELAHL